jgi:hypothetical protein
MEFGVGEMVIFSRAIGRGALIGLEVVIAVSGATFILLALLVRRGAWIGALPGLVGGVTAPLVALVTATRRRQVRLSKEGWGTRFGYGVVKMKKWDGYKVELKHGWTRVYLKIGNQWGGLFIPIDCSYAQVETLRAEIERATGRQVVVK